MPVRACSGDVRVADGDVCLPARCMGVPAAEGGEREGDQNGKQESDKARGGGRRIRFPFRTGQVQSQPARPSNVLDYQR